MLSTNNTVKLKKSIISYSHIIKTSFKLFSAAREKVSFEVDSTSDDSDTEAPAEESATFRFFENMKKIGKSDGRSW